MNNKFLFICMLSIILACNTQYHSKIVINNRTGKEIDSIIIGAYNVNIKFTDIGPGERTIREYNFIPGKSKYEGAFLIHIYTKGLLRDSGTFGYFANPAAIQNRYEITIYDDFKYKETINE